MFKAHPHLQRIDEIARAMPVMCASSQVSAATLTRLRYAPMSKTSI